MENVNAQDKDFDLDEYLDKWNEENIESDFDEETEEATAETDADPSEEGNDESDGSSSEGEANGEDTEEGADTDADEDSFEDAAEKPEATEAAEKAPEETPTEDGNEEALGFKSRIEAAVAEIGAQYPEVTKPEDIGNVRMFAVLTSVGGMSAIDAYKALNDKKVQEAPPATEKTTDDAIIEAETRGARRAASKSHLQGVVPKGAAEGSELTDSEVDRLSEDLGFTKEEVRKYHKRINKN